MSDAPIVLHVANTAPPVREVWMFVSRDRDGQENTLGSVIGALGTQPLITGNPRVLEIFKAAAVRVREEMKKHPEAGQTIHLLRFTQREEVSF